MNASRLKWAAWAVGLGVVAGASGRSIPVYRVYSQPIVFYDEMGQRTEYDRQAPDMVALQSLRDTKSQEFLMGRETLMEMTMEPGRSVFGERTDSFRGALPVAAGEPDGRRRRQEESSRNWLVQSLPLPSLGQAASNAALMAMSSRGEESTWGWLADDIAQKAEQQALEFLAEEGRQLELEAGSHGAPNPFAISRPGPRVSGSAAESGARASPPARDEGGMSSPDRARERMPTAGRDSSMTDRIAGAAPAGGREVPSGVADMSQTRQLISDMSSSVRLDLPSLRNIRESSSAPPPARDASGPGRPFGGSGPGLSSGPAWSGAGARSTVGLEPVGPGSRTGQRTAWQGGWSSAGSGERSPLRMDVLQDAMPPPVAPAATRGMPATAPPSGRRLGWH